MAITVRELRNQLRGLDGDLAVYLSGDSEGEDFRPVWGIEMYSDAAEIGLDAIDVAIIWPGW